MANDKDFRHDRRVVGYVAKQNKDKLCKYASREGLPVSRAIDIILTKFFSVKQ